MPTIILLFISFYYFCQQLFSLFLFLSFPVTLIFFFPILNKQILKCSSVFKTRIYKANIRLHRQQKSSFFCNVWFLISLLERNFQSNQSENTGSRLIPEVCHCRALLVFTWGVTSCNLKYISIKVTYKRLTSFKKQIKLWKQHIAYSSFWTCDRKKFC